jgi:uncharacterized protein YegP (UPF0339 family)
MAAKFELYEDAAGEFRFRLKAANGEIVLSSQGYTTKVNALNGIESVKSNAGDPSQYERSETETGKFRFALKAKNHEVIGQSQNYESASGRDHGIEAVGRAADGAEVDLLKKVHLEV